MIGFSMGAGLCYHVALRLDFPIGGIIPISGMIRNPESLFPHATKVSRNTPILILHGTDDDIVTVDRGQEAFDLLVEHGYCVRLELYKAKHKIPLSANDLIIQFIQDNEQFESAQVDSIEE